MKEPVVPSSSAPLGTPWLHQLPNFFIIGAAKSGTTALWEYLNQHPDFYTGNGKEPHFFAREVNYAKGLKSYLSHYPDAHRYSLRGDASPIYLNNADVVIPRLKAVYGDHRLKFIAIFRDPVARAWSHYLHRLGRDEDHLDFAAALRAEPERNASSLWWYGYRNDGFYGQQVKQWLTHYDRSQFHFLLTDDLKQNPSEVVYSTLRFLGLRTDISINFSRRQNSVVYMRSPWFYRKIRKPSKYLQVLGKLLVPHFKLRQTVYAKPLRIGWSTNLRKSTRLPLFSILRLPSNCAQIIGKTS